MTPPQSTEPAAATGPPDWTASDAQIECPLCEYNLRGLSETRCPECGYTFTWAEVLDPNRRRHPYLFEHHPEHNARAFFRTVAGALRPRRFWRTLHPTQPARPWRLVAYLLLVLLVLALPPALGSVIGMPDTPAKPTPWGIAPVQTLRRQLGFRATANLPHHLVQPLVRAHLWKLVWTFSIFCAAWLPITFALLLIFRASMRRARVRLHHVARCVVYGFDVVAWWAFLLAVTLVVNAQPYSPGIAAEAIAWFILFSIPILWLVMSYRLATAYELYLRFDHARWTIFAVQFIVALLFLLALLMLRDIL